MKGKLRLGQELAPAGPAPVVAPVVTWLNPPRNGWYDFMPGLPMFASTQRTKRLPPLVKTCRRIGIEDLNVRGMPASVILPVRLWMAAFANFGGNSNTKARFYGAVVVVADKRFPPSKTCFGRG